MKTDNEQIPEALNVSETTDVESQVVEEKKSKTPLNVGIAAAGAVAGVSVAMAADSIVSPDGATDPEEDTLDAETADTQPVAPIAAPSAAPHRATAAVEHGNLPEAENVSRDDEDADDGDDEAAEVQEEDMMEIFHGDGVVETIPVSQLPEIEENPEPDPIPYEGPADDFNVDDIQIDDNLIID